MDIYSHFLPKNKIHFDENCVKLQLKSFSVASFLFYSFSQLFFFSLKIASSCYRSPYFVYDFSRFKLAIIQRKENRCACTKEMECFKNKNVKLVRRMRIMLEIIWRNAIRLLHSRKTFVFVSKENEYRWNAIWVSVWDIWYNNSHILQSTKWQFSPQCSSKNQTYLGNITKATASFRESIHFANQQSRDDDPFLTVLLAQIKFEKWNVSIFVLAIFFFIFSNIFFEWITFLIAFAKYLYFSLKKGIRINHIFRWNVTVNICLNEIQWW